MIKSMTGFASRTSEDEVVSVAVTAKSVNHRFLDLQIRASDLAELESDLRALVQATVARGRVELAVTLRLTTPPSATVEVNESLVTALSGLVETANMRGWVSGRLTPGDLLRFAQVVTVRQEPVAADTWRHACDVVKTTVKATLTELDAMRRREGDFLRADLEGRCTALRELVDRIASHAAEGETEFRARLETKVSELAASLQLEPAVITQEVAKLAARSDIHEEVARLRGHLDHWNALAGGDAPCGRKLDFLLQEMNREVNTIGSKAEGHGMVSLIVDAKAELEKLREQTQNVE